MMFRVRVLLCLYFYMQHAFGACNNELFGKLLTSTSPKEEVIETCVNGNGLDDIEVFNPGRLTFELSIKSINNFKTLKEVNLFNRNLKYVPKFYDLPNIQQISLSLNEIEVIHEGDFSEVPVHHIMLSRNKIYQIEDGSFGENVGYVSLTCNVLTNISPKWFNNPAALKSITLDANNISSLPENLFRNFTSLTFISLRQNKLATIGAGAFTGTTSFIELTLSYNRLYEIPSNAFLPANITIDTLDIEYNRISFLHDAFLDKLTVEKIRTWANPWQCPCKTKIEKWFQKQGKNNRDGLKRERDPVCVYALSFANTCVQYVDPELYIEFLKNFKTYPIQICPQRILAAGPPAKFYPPPPPSH